MFQESRLDFNCLLSIKVIKANWVQSFLRLVPLHVFIGLFYKPYWEKYSCKTYATVFGEKLMFSCLSISPSSKHRANVTAQSCLKSQEFWKSAILYIVQGGASLVASSTGTCTRCPLVLLRQCCLKFASSRFLKYLIFSMNLHYSHSVFADICYNRSRLILSPLSAQCVWSYFIYI